MSNEKSALEAILSQYEEGNKPRFEKAETAKVYDLKNYFTTYDLEKGEQSKTKEIRILPNSSGGSPLVIFHGHTAMVDGAKKTFACLQHEKGTACPFCEAREALLAEGDAASKELAKKYSAKKMYLAKIIDRNNEEDGVKFWRFNHDYRKEGVFDKIHGLLSGLKKNKDIFDPTTGRDLSIVINRNQTGIPIISSITPQDSTPLSENEELSKEWLSDERTWEDVYAVRSYDYLEIIIMGGVPMWDKDAKCFVDKNKVDLSDETSKLEDELVMKADNVKSTLKAAETKTNPTSTTEEVEDEEEDDLPF